MSDIRKIHAALAFLRMQDEEKTAGVVSTVKDVARAIKGGAVHGAKALEAKGHKNLATLLKYSPEIAGAGLAYKAYESPTGQNLRYKYRLWKAQRQQRQQMGY
jgi:uncharacterized membrane protein YebE (DUF533 family)